jgi:amino acid adenylation domain-containing protein
MQTDETTLFQLGLAAFHIFLFKLTLETDLCVININANRHRSEVQDIIGFFSNTLPQRVIIDPHATVSQLLHRVKELCLETLAHAYLPYQDMGSLPGIQTLFLAEPVLEEVEVESALLVHQSSTVGLRVAKFDLTCSLQHNPRTHSITVSLNASCDFFDDATVSNMARRFERLLIQLFTSASSIVCTLSLRLPHEIELLRDMDTHSTLQHATHLLPIHYEFACRVNDHPQKIGAILDDQSLTYAEMLYHSQLLTNHLVDVCHVRPKDIVVTCVERSLEMPLAILATLMSGAIYCPLSPSHPQERLQALLNQTKASCILTHHRTKDKFESTSVNLSCCLLSDATYAIGRLSSVRITAIDQVAYIIFTSGSTGEPKGVQLTHRNLLLTVTSFAHIGSLSRTDTAIQITPCTFDAHVPELLGCLILGGTLILLHPDGNMQLDYLTHLIERHQSSYMHSVPSHLAIICEHLDQENIFDRLSTLRSLCSSGEPINVRCLTKFQQNTRATIFNLYGPAECTDVSIYKIDQDITTMIEPTCIGYLSPNLTCRILDPFMQSILPDGHQTGELYVSGQTVFAGYLNRNDLTQRVLISGITNGRQYYKTGDLVRQDSRGRLHYVGRQDFMIKLRGQRIELAEVEQTIIDASVQVTKCVVVKHKSSITGHEYLVAFVQTTDRNIEQMLQEKCQQRLPSYMIPSVFITLDKLPLSENGKVDRTRLPLSNIFHSQAPEHGSNHSQTEMERHIATIWSEILQLSSKPSTTDNFFKLGGNSLLLMKLHHAYQTQFQQSLNISDLFRQATVADHAHLLEANQLTTGVSSWHALNIIEGKLY